MRNWETDEWGRSRRVSELEAAENAALAAMGRFIGRRWRWLLLGLALLCVWMFARALMAWALWLGAAWAVAAAIYEWRSGRRMITAFARDITAGPRAHIGAWRRKLDAKAARLDAGPDAPVFLGPSRDDDDADMRRTFVMIGRMTLPSDGDRLTFANVWGLMLERGDNPVQRLFSLAETAAPAPLAYAAAASIPPEGARESVKIAVSGGGGVYRLIAFGLGATTLVTGAAWAWGEMIEQPRLERRAAEAERLTVALDEAAAANDAMNRALETERALRARENAAAIEYRIDVERELGRIRQRLAAESAQRRAAEEAARRAINEAEGRGPRRTDDDWLRDTFPDRAPAAGGLPGVPGADARAGDP